MNKKLISTILLIIFAVTIAFTVANTFMSDNQTLENQTGTITVGNKTVNYEKTGKCVEVIDGNTIQVYGVGKVQLTQIGSPTNDATQFVKDNCLGKTVYLDVDDEKPTDDYERVLAIVYTQDHDINKELLDNGFAKLSYFEPSEFEKGEV